MSQFLCFCWEIFAATLIPWCECVFLLIYDWAEMPNVMLIMHLSFRTHTSPQLRVCLLPSGAQAKMIDPKFCVRILINRICQKMIIILRYPIFLFSFLQKCWFHFVHQNNFLLKSLWIEIAWFFHNQRSFHDRPKMQKNATITLIASIICDKTLLG